MLAILNVRWALDGSLGFQELHGRTVVASARLESPGLLLWRVAPRAEQSVNRSSLAQHSLVVTPCALPALLACLILSVAPLVLSVRRYNAKEKEPHEILPFVFYGGMEVLLLYFTLWTWCIMTLYFLLASSASFVYVAWGFDPTTLVTTGLCVSFDIATCLIGTSLPVELATRLKCPTTERAEHSIFPAYVVLAYAVWNWWLQSKMGHWLYFFMDYNRPSMIPTFFMLVGINVASFRAGASLVGLGA
ncbi:Kif9 [Symbiodinium necroappetens]|uniref:Kif9 protein n=1 Tax=Symbiodinium necroappetens TaxID=1628268 RepID=A0A812XDJ5_9DINO|nr:Kif9 [Symbiodinium necroappetens]